MLYWINLCLAAATFVLCFCISVIVLTWCYYIDRKRTSFAFWFFLGVVGIKFSFAVIAIGNVSSIWIDNASPPLWTLPGRILLVGWLALHFYLIKNVRVAEFGSIQFNQRR